jgi:hypothetical protein
VRHIVVLTLTAALALGGLGTGRSDAQPNHDSTVPKPTAGGDSGGSSATAAKRKHKATTLGQVGVGACSPTAPAAAVVDTQAPGQASYVAPYAGVLTAFAHQANEKPGKVQLLVFADGATATQKTVVAKSDKLTVATNQLNIFPVRVPIAKGQKLGLGWSATGMSCALAADYGGDRTLVKGSFDADSETAFIADGVLANGTHTFRPDVSAVLEPDADRDGYGDVSQDGCVASKAVQVSCPDTKIRKRPKHLVTRTKVKVKVKFTSTVPGSTFECRFDGHKKWHPCTSPFKRRFGPGTHTLQVRAVGPNGVADPKPAKVKFTVRRR